MPPSPLNVTSSEAPMGRPRGGEMVKVGGAARARTVNEIKNRRRQSRGAVCYARDCRRRFLISSIARALAGPSIFTISPRPVGAPRGSLTGGHVKVMLAYGHSLSHGLQGFRPFSPDHREAAGPVGPALSSAQVHCKLQTVASCALATASAAVVEGSNFSKVLLLWNVAVAQGAYMG